MQTRSSGNQNDDIISVKDLMTKNIVSVLPETSVVEVSKIMSSRDISSILIKNQGNYSGIITDRDVMTRIVASGLDPRTPVSRVMSSPLISINEDAGIEEAAEMMRDNKIRRLIVKNDSEIVGIISETDIARIEPELHLLIRERTRLGLDSSDFSEGRKSFAGQCEECDNYSSLENIDGRWLCKECR